jgi:hypothetical protein
MIVPHDEAHLTSPSCVIVEVKGQSGLKQEFHGDPFLFTSLGVRLDVNTVSFSPQVTEHPSPWTLDEVVAQDIWYSRSDIGAFKKVARRDSKAFLKRYRAFTETFNAMFQDCSRPDLKMRTLQDTDSVKAVMAFPADIRGLEFRVVPLVRQYRSFHVQSVLCIQGESDSFRRARSMSISRPCRAVARLLASSDANEVALMVREELNFGIPSGDRNHHNGHEPQDADKRLTH